MKITSRTMMLASIALLLAVSDSAHAQVTMTASDGGGNSSISGGPYNWSSAAGLSAGSAPTAGYTYTDNGYLMRTPASSGASYTFGGDSLTLQGFTYNPASQTNNGAIVLKTALSTGNTITINNLIMDGGGINNGISNFTSFVEDTIAGSIYLTANGGTFYETPNDNGVSALLITAPIADQPGNQGVLTVGNLNSATADLNEVIIDAPDTHSGATTVSNYSNLQIGNGDTNGTLSNTSGVNLVNANSKLTFDRTDSGLVISASISGSGSVNQIGAGTTTLTGANSYSGGTTISAGALAVSTTGLNSATGTGNVTLGSGTLAGVGTIAGAVNASGAHGSSNITAGSLSSIGNLSFQSGVASSTGLTLNFGIDGAGATNSAITLSGSGLTVSGGLTFNLYDMGTDSLQANTPYTLISGLGNISADSININLLNSSYTLNSSYGTGGVLLNGDTATFELAVPEPSAYLLIGAGLGMILIFRKRVAC